MRVQPHDRLKRAVLLEDVEHLLSRVLTLVVNLAAATVIAAIAIVTIGCVGSARRPGKVVSYIFCYLLLSHLVDLASALRCLRIDD